MKASNDLYNDEEMNDNRYEENDNEEEENTIFYWLCIEWRRLF